VFERLFSEIRKRGTDDSIIYIGGDVAHSKLELSPELISQISWLFTECSNLCPTILIAGNHDCFTPEHEVLTTTGWVRLDDYINRNRSNDDRQPVATFNIYTREIEYQSPLNTIEKRHIGELIHFVGKDVEQIVTPTHNILHTYTTYPNRFYKKQAKDIKLRTPIPLNGIVANYIPNAFAKLLGFSFADGTFVLRTDKGVNGACRVQFHLKKKRKIDYLCNILDELHYKYNVKAKEDGTVYISIYSELAKDVCKFFNGIKEIPLSILQQDNSFLKSFISGYLNGDGNTLAKNYWRFSSINKQSIDLLVTIARLCGYTSRLSSKISYGRYTNSKKQYNASCTDSNTVRNSQIRKIDTVAYDGMVYCLSVPNENLLIRYNDKISISGNCNMNNTDRLDALTPIVDALNLPNFTYLRDTTVHYVDDVAFAVFSIFDKRSNWPSPNDPIFDAARLKVALFHGPVDNSTTDVGYVVSSRHFTTDIFDGYDAVFAGDIHKRQQLISPSGCKIVYPSSTIQQNFGESLDGHGMVVWDMDTLEWEAVDIPNDYGYYTMYVDAGVVPDVDNIPPKARVRVKLSNTGVAETANVIAEIKIKYGISDFTIIRTDSYNKAKSTTIKKFDFENLTDVSHQNELIVDYIKRIYPNITDSELKTIRGINIDNNVKITLDDVQRNINWKPKRFEFSNMFSYGEDNSIDFTKLGGLMGLFAMNATGKCVNPTTQIDVEFDEADIISKLGFLPDELK
jgi:DNA repair exonuclease SbcCD nuclease subunit